MVSARNLSAVAAMLGLTACARAAAPPAAPPAVDMRPVAPGRDTTAAATTLPAVPPASGPLRIQVVYPPPDAVVRAKDSSFLLGSVGTGDATLTINGYPVKVWPNGAWLAWIPMPPDSLMRFHLVATTPAESVELDYDVRRGGWSPLPAPGLWLDSTSLAPRGRVWWPASEYLTLSARASEGAQVRMVLSDGSVVPLLPQSRLEEIPEATRAFDRDTANLTTALRRDQTLLESLLREHRATRLETAEQRSELRGRIFGVGILSGQHVLSSGWGQEHGGKLQEGLSRPGRGIHGLKPGLRQEGRNPVCIWSCEQSGVVCQ